MNATGKKKLIKSLKPYLQSWLDNADPNGEDNTDVGYIGEHTVELLATVVVTTLELSAEAQSYAVKEGLLFVEQNTEPEHDPQTLATAR